MRWRLTLAVVCVSLGCAARLAPARLADLTERAGAGDVAVQLELGDRYGRGRGVDRNSAEAARWYRAAADNGAPTALSRLVCLGRGHYQPAELLGDDGVFPSSLPRADAEGITPPTLVTKVEPRYTSAAMRSKIMGEVRIDGVVMPNGAIGEARIQTSLDAAHGLDEEALCAAHQLRFRPAVRDGQPIATVVTLILEFRLH